MPSSQPPNKRRQHGRRRRGIHQNKQQIMIVGTMLVLLALWLVVGIAFLMQQQHGQVPRSRGWLRAPDLFTNQNAVQFPPNFPTMQHSLEVSQEAIDMCHGTLWHTLETTTIVLPNNETFIHTGDIDDLWLRDSAAQVHPLLVPFERSGTRVSLIQSDLRLQRVVSGLIKRVAWYIRHDPYANAFRIDDTYVFSPQQKLLGRHDYISTWNYELDSACYYVRMLYYFYKAVPHHAILREESVYQAVQIMVDVWIAEQHHENDQSARGPLLDCQNCGKPYRYPGLSRNGKGTPTAYTGMTWSGFRPSDDECQYGYSVPANMFAVVVLKYIVEMAPVLWNQKQNVDDLVQKASKLAKEIKTGIETHGIVHHDVHGKIYAYEVDGLGNSLLMDDANVPSLMSIPYLGYDYQDEIYKNTRRFILSQDNPTFSLGTNPHTGDIQGYGSPHMKARIPNNIWPMALAMQGLSSDSTEEKLTMVNQLVASTGNTGWMHESFDVNNPARYTRSWFCWADSLFAELVMSVTDKCPLPEQHKYKILSWRDSIHEVGGPYAATTAGDATT